MRRFSILSNSSCKNRERRHSCRLQWIGEILRGRQECRPSLWIALVLLVAGSRAFGFEQTVGPFLEAYCVRCHNPDKMKSGVRVDNLDASLQDQQLRLWEHILTLIEDGEMPPEDEKQPAAEERAATIAWIEKALHEARSREVERNGSIRRLTVAQYRNTLRDLLGIEDDLTDILPADAVSKDGFVNNEQTLELSPLLLEAYFEIAERALDLCIVDVNHKPKIQNFRMDLGKGINPDPLPEKLILGALNHLLPNPDFMVTELVPQKPVAFEPFFMQKKLRFNEGYAGNSTVRGWRDYDSIYHSVFACMRGDGGYPRGKPYDLVPEGLLLRPAIPSAEMFKVQSTYGPKANFKVSLRQLPDEGNFRITVRAAKYDDGLLLDGATEKIEEGITVSEPTKPQTVQIDKAGVYQVEAYRTRPVVKPDGTKLAEGRAGVWNFDDSGTVDSPFGKATDQIVEFPREDRMNVGEGDFSVAAWIKPSKLQQGGIVTLGRYGQRGWVFDMPNGGGVLRVETFKDPGVRNGTVQSRGGAIRNGEWQHVAAVVERGENLTRLFVNGYEVARGTVPVTDLNAPSDVNMFVGRVPSANVFAGSIDEVQLFHRALGDTEIQALVEPGRQFVKPPPEGRRDFKLKLGDRHFSGILDKAPFVAIRLPEGPLKVAAKYAGTSIVDRIVLAPMQNTAAFERFESRSPNLGVHLGLRRDCGSTLNPVGKPRVVSDHQINEFIFEGAIDNFPSPDVEKDNVNYLAGLREIGVRSEYTDGRDRPRLVVRSVEFEGPYFETWPPKPHRQIFTSDDPLEVIRNFATRAFRRPLTDGEMASFAALHEETGSVRDVLTVILTSAQFLFIIEDSKGPESEDLAPFELASKLAYFLWNALPDRQLLDLAASGDLAKELDAEITRMIADERFEQFTNEFVTQWLSLDKLQTVETDRKRFPLLTRDAKTHLRDEPIRFIEHLIREDLHVQNLIRSDFIVANEVVANYYELGDKTESGFAFRPIPHENPQLGGVLTQAGILAALSDGREANPIKRGAWFARKIIAKPPADPPPNVAELPEGDEHLTLREKLEKHRDVEGCAKCHEGIDPWGLPFEQFDAGGRFVEEAEATSVLPDRSTISGVDELKRYLAEEQLNQVAFSFLKHLATYAVGRDLSYAETESLREQTREMPPEEMRMQAMLRWMVHSDIFLKK